MKRRVWTALVIAAALASAWQCGFSFSLLARRGGQFFFILKKMVPPDWSFVPTLIEPLRQTAAQHIPSPLRQSCKIRA